MIHIFKNFYLTLDSDIDESFDRVVISELIGQQTFKSLEGTKGKLICGSLSIDDFVGPNKIYSSWQNFFDEMYNYNSKVILYTNKEQLIEILCLWFFSIFKKPDVVKTFNLIKSILYRYLVFNSSRFNNKDKKNTNFSIDYVEYKKSYDRIKFQKIDVQKYKNDLSLEYYLSSYLYDNSYKELLKKNILIMLRKDLVKYFYEVKEIFLVHLMTKNFTDHLKLTKEYNFENFTEIENDESEFVKLFTNDNIWNTKYTSLIFNDNKDINIESITEKDKETFFKFARIAGNCWNEENIYSFVKSDIKKLDFLVCFENFTDELLEKLLEVESSTQHAAGSFFSIDLKTVNHYFIQALLANKNNKQFLENYILT